MPLPSLALIGPGAVGCTVFAYLAQTGRFPLTIAARTPFAALRAETATGLIVRQPRVLTAPDQVSGPVDWVFLATKAYDVASALPWLDRFAGPATRIALLQNGVEHLDRLPARFPRPALVPVIVDLPAERIAPGHVRHRGIARLTVPDDAPGRDFAALFADTPIEAATTTDWKTAAWRKLCLNAGGAVCAAALRPTGIVHFAPVADIMRGLIRETVQVGRAEGAQLDDDLVEAIIAREQSAPRDAVNSLYADRLAGQPMEVDARNGAVVRFGRRHGIPTPYNETLAGLLAATREPV